MTHPIQNVECGHFLFKPYDCMCVLKCRLGQNFHITLVFLVPVAVPVRSSTLNDHQRDDDLEETENIDEMMMNSR